MPRQPSNSSEFFTGRVEVRFSPLSSIGKIVDEIFSYTDRNTDFTERFFVRCDVMEEFPFLVPNCRRSMTGDLTKEELNERLESSLIRRRPVA